MSPDDLPKLTDPGFWTGRGCTMLGGAFLSVLGVAAAVVLEGEPVGGIEDQEKWILNLAFRENESRIRKGNGFQNSAVLRHIAPNLLRHGDTANISIRASRKKAGWESDCLHKVLAN